MRTAAVALLFGNDQERGTALATLVEKQLALNADPKTVLCPVNLPGTSYRRMLRHAETVERSALAFAERKRDKLDPQDLVSIIANSPDECGAPPTDHLIAGHIPILFAASYETCQSVLVS